MPSRLPLLLAAALATPAPAQDVPVATVSPTPSPTPAVALPPAASAVPPPIAITLPTPTPTPALTPTRAAPAPLAAATPRERPTPTPTPTPTPSATPESPPSPGAAAPAPTLTTPATVAAPAPAPSTLAGGRPATALPIPPERGSPWMLPTVGGLLIALVLVALAARRRRRAADPDPHPVPVVTEQVEASRPAAPRAPVAPAAPSPAAPSPAAPPRAWIALELRPRRAGVNLLTATLDAEVIVRNEGEAAAEDVRVVLRLLSARADQEAELEAVATDAAARAIAAPFSLAPGEERAMAAIATLPRADINVMTVADRAMFVPVAALGARYVTDGEAGVTATAFALGVEREGADKLAPFFLDAPARMHDAVGVRPHVLSVRR